MTKGRRGRAGKGLATVLAATAVLIAGCGSKPPAGPGTGTASAKPSMPSKGTASVQIGGRRLTVHVPDSYDADRAARAVPLVLLLHGYSSNGVEQESYLNFTPESDRRGFIYAYPEGTRDSRNNQYWNATDAC